MLNQSNSAYDANGCRTSHHFFEFPKDAQRRNRWCTLIKRRHGQGGFVVSSSTVLCHEHFRAEDISKKLSGRWDLRKGLWYCSAFVVCLLCLHGSRAVFGYITKSYIVVVFINQTPFKLSQITDFAIEWYLSFKILLSKLILCCCSLSARVKSFLHCSAVHWC